MNTYYKIKERGILSEKKFSSLNEVKRYVSEFCNKRDFFDGRIVQKIENGKEIDYYVIYVSEYGSKIILFNSEMEYDAHKASIASRY